MGNANLGMLKLASFRTWPAFGIVTLIDYQFVDQVLGTDLLLLLLFFISLQN